MDNAGMARTAKPATAARMYDYFLGGIHNFPADRAAADRVIEQFPFVPAAARVNRAFLRRVVRALTAAGIRQFLDIGSGIPTGGNVHEIAQAVDPQTRVVYVDIDPVAVAESQELLAGNDLARAVQADLREPEVILDHPGVRGSLDFDRPIALLLFAVLHFVPDHAQAYNAVARLVDALAPGSYLAISHIAAETFLRSDEQATIAGNIYSQQTATPAWPRTRAEMSPFFAGLTMVDPGLVWSHEWRPDPDDNPSVAGAADETQRSGGWGGVGIKS